MTDSTHGGPTTRRGGGPFTGTTVLVRLALRRDRVRLAIWLAAVAALVVGTVASLEDLYPTVEDRQARAELMENPTLRLFTGPYGLDDYTFGPMVAAELGAITFVVVAVMALLTVVRHTRDEEESGRAELVRAGVVGRHAQPAAALAVATAASAAAGASVAVGLLVALDEPAVGALVLGTGTAACGVTFAAVGLVAAQLADHARAATSIASLALGATYLVGALGYTADLAAPAWLSPVHWSIEMRPYVGDRWWPLLFAVGVTVALLGAAVALAVRRDTGSGFVTSGAGPARARPRLGTPLGLALRLQRTSLVVWTVVLVLSGLLYGSVIDAMVSSAEDNEVLGDYLQQAGSGDFTESAVATIVYFLALPTAGFAIATVSVAGREERAGRAEPLLATAVGRVAWLGSHLAVAVAASMALLAGAGFGAGVGMVLAGDDTGRIAQLTRAALAYAPAAWVVAGVAVALYGLVPRATAAAWGYLVAILGIGLFGPLLSLPDRVHDLVAFDHVPQLPSESFTVVPVLGLLAVAVLATAAGLVGFRRRDLESS